jgi:post-segregation antitoxin (ccd killing protein)
MASIRTTISLSPELAVEARRLGVNVSAAARQGVFDAVRQASALADREAYRNHPEGPGDGWDDAEAWGDG